jgi:anti-sigma regulatory factor (Ser/Thr protein kinase)
MMEQKFKRSFDELENIVTMTEVLFREEGLPPGLRNVVDLATEELFVNMVSYNTETNEDILIEMESQEGGVQVRLTDYDVERFDPTIVGPIDVDAPLDDRTPGGLGLYLVLKMVDSIHYEYQDRKSTITFFINRK